jgi:hypothetical protein
MNRDKSDTTTQPLFALSVFRGIYKRVAVQLDIDPSYVSRVARGERNAPFVSDALRKEIRRVLGKAGLHNGNGNGALHDGAGKNHDHSNGTMVALLDGHQTGRNHRDGHFENSNHNHDGASLDGHRGGQARDGHLRAVDGNQTSATGKKAGRKSRTTPAKKSASSARRRKP